MWFNLAVASGDVLAMQAMTERDSIPSKMTPEHISEAQRLAREWKRKKTQ